MDPGENGHGSSFDEGSEPVGPPDVPGAAPAHPLLRVRMGPLLAIGVIAFAIPLGAGLARPAVASGRDFVILASVVTYGIFIAWMAIALPRARISWRRLLGRPPSPGRVFEIVAVALMHVMFAGFSFVLMLALLHRIAPRLAQELADIAAMSAPSGPPAPGLFLMVAVAAPIVEELLFRGLMLQHFALRWGATRAVLVSSAIFAVLHPQHPVGLFVFSVLLSLLFLSSRSLIVTIVAHAVTNASLLLIAGSAGRAGARAPQVSELLVMAPTAALGAGLVGLFVALYMMRRWPRPGTPIPYDASVDEAAPRV